MNPELDRPYQTVRLLVAAMAMCVAAFGAFVVFLITGGVAHTDSSWARVLLLALVGAALIEASVYALARAITTERARREWEGVAPTEESAAGLRKCYYALTLTAAGLAEAFGLFGIVVLLISGAWPAIAAPLIALLVIAVHFPTQARFNSFAGGMTGRHWA